MMTLHDLKLQVATAEHVLRDMSDMGMDCTAQVARCRELRRAMNQQCPDAEYYDPRADNIVEQPV